VSVGISCQGASSSGHIEAYVSGSVGGDDCLLGNYEFGDGVSACVVVPDCSEDWCVVGVLDEGEVRGANCVLMVVFCCVLLE